MSGWIKFEKDLQSDPRVTRMAKALQGQWSMVSGCNASALPGVTLVCGALARLWIFADSHARDDNTIDIGMDEIDELVGIPGFSKLMPSDWLLEVGPHTVELPEFQEHNGVEAKKKALTQKRVARHRSKDKPKSVSTRNASALPDQTRPDQTKTPKEAAAPPFDPNSIPGLDQKAWSMWIEHRKAIKEPILEHAMPVAAKRLAKLNGAQVEEVERAIAGGWQGLHPPQGKPSGQLSLDPPRKARMFNQP